MVSTIEAMQAGQLSALEAGILTVVERRGRLAVDAVLKSGSDAAEVTRRNALKRMHEAGLVEEVGPGPDSGRLEYAITELGRQILFRSLRRA